MIFFMATLLEKILADIKDPRARPVGWGSDNGRRISGSYPGRFDLLEALLQERRGKPGEKR
jgi:hypothetical protein